MSTMILTTLMVHCMIISVAMKQNQTRKIHLKTHLYMIYSINGRDLLVFYLLLRCILFIAALDLYYNFSYCCAVLFLVIFLILVPSLVRD